VPRLHVAILSFLALLTVAWVIFLAWGVFKIFRIALSGKPVDDELTGIDDVKISAGARRVM
jgi:hypothetical protein